jgi:RNA polymerase sigma-70 factor (ECF subfamily)
MHGDFEQLLERYGRLLRAQIARHCSNRPGIDVAEVEQEARLRLWKAMSEKDLRDPASYIYRVAVSATIDAVRKVIARREDPLPDPNEDGAGRPFLQAEASTSPDAILERKETAAAVARAIESLPLNRRQAVALHLQGFTLGEIAALLRWSEAKVRNLVYRGLEDLRESLRSKGIDVE